MQLLAVFFGALVGVSLGLTGGGGGILAVPMLVYGVGLPAHDAVLVSLMAVGATALVGAVERLRRREVEVSAGVVFALMGMLGAPLGAKLAQRLRPDHLLLLFSMLMILVAVRMWRGSSRKPNDTTAADAPADAPDDAELSYASAARATRARRVIMLVVLGVVTGVLSGLFGVGGGFLIVPALVLVTDMPIHRAVATSLLVIPLVSVAGVAQHLRQEEVHATRVMLLFVLGGVVGMFAGTAVGRRLSAVKLRRTFAVVIVAVAVFNVVMTLRRSDVGGRSEIRTSTSETRSN